MDENVERGKSNFAVCVSSLPVVVSNNPKLAVH